MSWQPPVRETFGVNDPDPWISFDARLLCGMCGRMFGDLLARLRDDGTCYEVNFANRRTPKRGVEAWGAIERHPGGGGGIVVSCHPRCGKRYGIRQADACRAIETAISQKRDHVIVGDGKFAIARRRRDL